MATTFIYGLQDPITGDLRYIGKADDPRARLKHHLWHAWRGFNSPRDCWIRTLSRQGLKPRLQLLEEIPTFGWQAVEREWIAELRSSGVPLLNVLRGGDGPPECTPATRAAIGANSAKHLTGRTLSAEHRANIAAGGRRRYEDPAERERQRTIALRIGSRPPVRRGEANNLARLTEQVVVAMRERRASGVAASVVAAEFGVSRSQVTDICGGRVWRHVGGPITSIRRKQRLSDADVVEIRSLVAAGERVGVIAIRFGVTSGQISHIKSGTARKSVPT